MYFKKIMEDLQHAYKDPIQKHPSYEDKFSRLAALNIPHPCLHNICMMWVEFSSMILKLLVLNTYT